MTTGKRPVFTDGVAPTVDDFNQGALGLDAFLQQILQHLFGDSEISGSSDGFFSTTVPNATDLGAATIPTYGFLGPSLRVRRVDATHIRLTPGMGLQYVTSGYPAGEWPLRVVRLGNDAPEVSPGITLGSLPSAGQYKRALVTVPWRDVTTTGSRQYIDASGNETPQTVNVRTRPEVGDLDGAGSGITITYGSAAASALLAARPSIPAGHLQLAELLLDSTGLANSANPDGNTSGITDLRPRLRPSKAGGSVDSRRATCSTDETTGTRNTHRIGAKGVGAEVVWGLVECPTSVGVVTLDTSRDWRDMIVTIEHGALVAAAMMPGDASDASFNFQSNPAAGSVTLAKVVFYTGSGSAAGTSGYYSGTSKAPSDGATTALIFFADSTNGHLKCRALADASGTQDLYFRAEGFGPLSRRLASGQES